MRCTSSLACLGLLSALVLGCDTNGYPDLGEKLDVVVPCGDNSTTWIRSTCGTHINGEEGHLMTEVLIMGTDDFSPTATASGCFLQSQLFYDTSGRLRQGSFTGTGGVADVQVGYQYEFQAQPDVGILNRRGSYRTELSPPEAAQFTYSSDGTTLTLTDMNTGESKEYRNVIDLVSTLDPTDQTEAMAFVRIFSIPLYHSFMRLLGFGGGGMSQYANAAEFNGAVSGLFYVRVDDVITMPKTILRYTQFEEFSGFYHDGEYDTVVGLTANGRSYGVLDFSFRDDPTDASSVATGSVDFTNVVVTNGFGADGCYNFYYESNPAVIVPAQIYNSIDLSDVLPTDGMAPPSGSACPAYDPWVGTFPTVCDPP